MTIKLAESDVQINACFAVMAQLRPHIQADEFLTLVKAQMQNGYQLAYIEVKGIPVACAGFRFSQCLAWGRFLYVDDLITDEQQRSQGYGKQLLDWLIEAARANGCQQLHLDSGVQRKAAHRFYEREGMTFTSHHYALEVSP